MFYIAPGNPIESPVEPRNTGRGGNSKEIETGLETMVAPLSPLAATTSGSFAPRTSSGKVVYTRPNTDDDKTRRKILPYGMEAGRPRYLNGDSLLERPDNKGFKRTALHHKKHHRKYHSESFSRLSLNLIEGSSVKSTDETGILPRLVGHPDDTKEPSDNAETQPKYKLVRSIGSVGNTKSPELKPDYDDEDSGWISDMWKDQVPIENPKQPESEQPKSSKALNTFSNKFGRKAVSPAKIREMQRSSLAKMKALETLANQRKLGIQSKNPEEREPLGLGGN